MKKIMIFLIASLVLALLLLSGCKKTVVPPVSEVACSVDSDCACGTHITTGNCFYGNKAFVNTTKQCPDFCTGIAAIFEIKCVDYACKQVKIVNNQTQTPVECNTDSDCAREQCCHATSCIPVDKKGVCTLLCTNVCMPGTLDCGGSCTCENNKCKANLNNLTEQVTPKPQPECTTDADCAPADCCHSATCIPASQKGVCNLACTQNCQPQTMDCGGFCACTNGKCVAELNDL